MTARANNPELDAIIGKEIKVLDKGFIRLIDYMGNDEAVCQAARVSYGSGTKTLNNDKGLIRYLMKHKHTTPFEMCEIKFHIKTPIFIARQWLRHRTASVNEYSARYSILENDFYLPDENKLYTQSKTNNQGRSEEALGKEEAKEVYGVLKGDSEKLFKDYASILNIDENGEPKDENKKGLTRELSRIILPMNTYTQFYWKINLHNLLHFLALRADGHAQYEIREFANAILDIVKMWVPITYNAFMDYKVNSASLDKNSLEVIKKLLNGEKIDKEEVKLSKREYSELKNLFNLKEDIY